MRTWRAWLRGFVLRMWQRATSFFFPSGFPVECPYGLHRDHHRHSAHLPDEAERVEPLTAVWRQFVLGGALHTDPHS